jgi:enamine deaminase RidA (YjgF/YER057c/UK114 family)
MRVLPVIGLIQPHSAFDTVPRKVTRHRLPGTDLPHAVAVEVPAGTAMVHLAGVTPPPARTTRATDTGSQSRAVLRAIEAILRRLELGLGDIVTMTVFLVGVPEREGRMDLDGFLAAYREMFGTPVQPNLPVRSVVQVAALADPSWLVEIEVSAARPAG